MHTIAAPPAKAVRWFSSRTVMALVFLILCSLAGTGCDPKASGDISLTSSFTPGLFISHDLDLENTSGKALTEIHLTITFVGENASPVETRYWTSWPLGESRTVSISTGSAKNVQRVEIKGYCNEGKIHEILEKR